MSTSSVTNLNDLVALVAGDAPAAGLAGVLVVGQVTDTMDLQPFAGADGRMVNVDGTKVEVKFGESSKSYFYVMFPRGVRIPGIGQRVVAVVDGVKTNQRGGTGGKIRIDPSGEPVYAAA